jgi:DNA polymerase III subunit alpha
VSPQQFVHLHNHSDYSLLDGASMVDRLVDTAAAMNMPAVALTDHGNLFGAVQLCYFAKKKKIKPIVGCEVYVAKESRHKKSGGGDQSNHLVLLVENAEGYSNLSRLVSYGYLEGFYYKPRIDRELLASHSKGLIALSACLKGAVAQKITMDQYESARNEAVELQDIFGAGNFFLELQDHNLPPQKIANEGLLRIASETGMPLVCTNDSHYLNRDDSFAHDVLLCIGNGKTVEDADRMRYTGDQFYFKSADEMARLFGHIPESMLNTLRIAERCNLEMAVNDCLPPFAVPDGYTSDTYFEEVVRQGFAARLQHLEPAAREGKLKKPISEYRERLEFEIQMIKKMRFPSYFLIVWDLIKYARDHSIPSGPGRGSVVGSLVAYSLRITDVDPLQYDLFFERFLNPERIAPPDIDMDFCKARRPEMIEYAAAKYGRENVSQIITFNTMAAKAAIRDVGRSLNIPYAEVDRIAKLIPKDLKITLDKALSQEPRLKEEMDKNEKIATLIETAKRLEGMSRNAGIHAAGVVIAGRPLIELVPLHKSNEGDITTQYSMIDLEAVGLLKMDFLGLATLTVIADAVRRVHEETGDPLDIDSLPLDDAKTYELFSEGKTIGIFQFESGGMQAELRRLKPERFEDLIALNALYRPGPMDMIPEFIARKHGRVKVSYPHPLLEEILKETYGVIVYQEQVMQIASKMAGFTLGEADILRKAMGKKLEDVMAASRTKFLSGAQKKGIPEKIAVQVFDLIKQFAQYGFNKSHATAYALLAYQTAYLKAHYPVQFMAALLTGEVDKTEKIVMYIAESREMGIPVLPPDINESDLYFVSAGKKIRFGMLAIKGLGEGAVRSILEVRKKKGRFRSLYQLCEDVDSRGVNKRVLESLVKSGALDSLKWRRSQLMASLDSAIEHGQRAQRDRLTGQKGLFSGGAAFAASQPEPAPPDAPEWAPDQLLAFEKETIGFYVSGHPLDRYAADLKRHSKKTIAELVGEGQSVECKVAGIVVDCRQRRTKKGDLMAVFNLEDLSATVEAVVFPKDYAKYEQYLIADTPILVGGRFEVEEENRCKIICSEIQPLHGFKERNARSLYIKAPIRKLSPETAGELHRLFEANRGETGVELELFNPHDFRVTIQSADFVKVKASPELVRRIEDLCGSGSVQLLN